MMKSLVRRHHPSCIFLCETKSNRNRLERVCRRLGFHNAEIVEAKGSAGGLCLMWTDDYNIRISWSSDQIVCRNVSGFGREYQLVFPSLS